MRLLVQRVKRAKVTVAEETVGAIGPGLLAFLGVKRDDTESVIPWLVKKLVHLRIFCDEQGKMNRSVQEVGGQILIVSQFTLYADCRDGRRPDFLQAASGDHAQLLYEQFVAGVEQMMGGVERGQFAAAMEVELVNDGPVTIIIDTPEKPKSGALL